MTPFGDRAARFSIDPDVPRRALLDALEAVPGVVDVVLTEEIGCVIWDDAADPAAIEHDVRAAVAAVERSRGARPAASHVIRVLYDGEDLDAVANTIKRSREAVVALHAEPTYRVAMLGFLPGFGYLRGIADELALPRRAPRPRVPAGSVAIAARYTGIYPYASPGGWHLLGRAIDFEPFQNERAALAIGDDVRFSPVSAADAPAPRPPAPPPAAPPTRPHLEVVRAQGMVLLVDGGRPGRMHEGVPPGGPLVRSLLARANGLAENAPSTCAIEISGTLEVVARGGSVVLADDDARVELAEGERHVVSTQNRARVAYLALAGGVDAPVVLGGRGALLLAGIGALIKRGDRLVPAQSGGNVGAPPSPPPIDDEPIAIVPGPDAVTGLSFEAMARCELRVSPSSDRTGTRLEGWRPDPAPPPGELQRPSAPMVAGAIELTPSGLIVLGPDHPTTGGYPVVALVRSASLDALFRRPFGSTVRFHCG